MEKPNDTTAGLPRRGLKEVCHRENVAQEGNIQMEWKLDWERGRARRGRTSRNLCRVLERKKKKEEILRNRRAQKIVKQSCLTISARREPGNFIWNPCIYNHTHTHAHTPQDSFDSCQIGYRHWICTASHPRVNSDNTKLEKENNLSSLWQTLMSCLAHCTQKWDLKMTTNITGQPLNSPAPTHQSPSTNIYTSTTILNTCRST